MCGELQGWPRTLSTDVVALEQDNGACLQLGTPAPNTDKGCTDHDSDLPCTNWTLVHCSGSNTSSSAVVKEK